jgi:hypothetical protein
MTTPVQLRQVLVQALTRHELLAPEIATSPIALAGLGRRLLVKLGVVLCVITCLFTGAALGVRVHQVPLGSLQRVGDAYYARDDFYAFYSAGRLVREGMGARVYTLEGMRAAEYETSGGRLGPGFTMPFFNPPYALLLLTPLAGLPLGTAGPIWLMLTLLLFCAGLAAVLSSYRRAIGAAAAVVGILAMVTSWPFAATVILGQFSFLIGLGGCLLFVSLRRPHSAYPILGLLLLSLKPQLLFLPIIFLLVQRRYRVLAGAVAVAAVLTFAAMALTGPHIFMDWLRLTSRAAGWDNEYTISSFHQFGWVGLLGGLLGPGHVVLRRSLVTALDAATIVGVGLLLWHGRERGRSATGLLALAIVGALIASANLNPQELVLLIPVLLVLYQSPEFKRGSVLVAGVAGWLATYLFLAVLGSVFSFTWPAGGMARNLHSNAVMLGLSYISPPTLYLIGLIIWLVVATGTILAPSLGWHAGRVAGPRVATPGASMRRTMS